MGNQTGLEEDRLVRCEDRREHGTDDSRVTSGPAPNAAARGTSGKEVETAWKTHHLAEPAED